MSFTQPSNFHAEALQHNLTQALALKSQVAVKLTKAQVAFRAADEANIAAATKVLDFKADKPDGGLSKGRAHYLRNVTRVQKKAQKEFENEGY